MANTLAPGLVPDVAAETAITVLQDKLASFDCYTQDFSDELVDPTRPVNIPIATSTSAVQTNPTNFETGDTTVADAQIAPVHYSKSFHLTQAELNSGHKLAHQLKINLHTLANALQDDVMGNITAANFANTPVVAATAGDFDTDDAKLLWAGVSDGDEKNMILQGDYYSQLLPVNRESFPGQGGNFDGAYGFDKIRYSNRFDSAEAGVVGFSVDPQALAIGGRVPATSAALANLMVNQQVIEIPGLGLSVQFNMWASTSTRSLWASYDLCFGSVVTDGSALTRLVTA
jgi:hypothetical protein